jgi:Histidine kinase
MNQPDPLPGTVFMARAQTAVSRPGPARQPGGDLDRDTQRRTDDVIVQRIFAAGLNLQLALGLIRDQRAAREVSRAIDELDRAIGDIRESVFSPGHR